MADHVEVAEGIHLACTVTGSEGPVWLQAHGAGSSGRFVRTAFADPVLDAGFRLATYDLRGHGDSSPVPVPTGHAIEHHVADMLAVASTLDAAVVGGVSLGGHAAVLAAPSLAIEAVVVCLPAWTGRSVTGQGPHAAVAAQVRASGVASLIDGIEEDTSMARWLRATLLTDFRRADPASLGAALEALDGGRAPDESELRALASPLGVVGWPDDPGHPLAVAARWAEVAQGPLVTTSIEAMATDPAALGRAAVACWRLLKTPP